MTALIQAFIFTYEMEDDTIRCIIAGDLKIVIIMRGFVYLTCISKTGETKRRIIHQLNLLYSLLISQLTSTFQRTLENSPSFELRNLISGNDKIFDHLINRMNNHPSYAVNSIQIMKLNDLMRFSIGNTLYYSRPQSNNNLLYMIMASNMQIINLVRPRKYILHNNDLHLLLNLVNSSPSLRSSESSWIPICLPQFNDKGFLYAYISYLWEDIFLILISAKIDDFYVLNECKNNLLESLSPSYYYSLESISSENDHYSISDVGFPGLLYFIYVHHVNQYTAPSLASPYSSPSERKRFLFYYD